MISEDRMRKIAPGSPKISRPVRGKPLRGDNGKPDHEPHRSRSALHGTQRLTSGSQRGPPPFLSEPGAQPPFPGSAFCVTSWTTAIESEQAKKISRAVRV